MYVATTGFGGMICDLDDYVIEQSSRLKVYPLSNQFIEALIGIGTGLANLRGRYGLSVHPGRYGSHKLGTYPLGASGMLR